MDKINLLLTQLKEMTKDLEIHNKIVFLVDEIQAEVIKLQKEVAKPCKKAKK